VVNIYKNQEGITMKTGFIGLGHLGRAMVQRLISQGEDLIVWNRTKAKAEGLGVETAKDPADLIDKAKVVFLNLFDSGAVEEVFTGARGILEGDCAGKLVIDTTTNHFDRVVYFYGMLMKNGGHYLECPVLGSVIPASQGNLTVLVSGDQETFDNALPFIRKIGANIIFLCKPGLATKMKLINNMVLGSFMATLAEAIAFGELAGVDKAKVMEILSAGPGNSAILNAKKEKLLKEDFTTHFSSALLYKDLHYMEDLAWTFKRPLFTGSIAKALYGMTFSRDSANDDFSGILRIMKEM
jgi:3-hydroxyisobutyrate dehydrogenase